MKHVVLLGDGMADDPQKERGGKTPLELADTPHLDMIADRGSQGLCSTVPEGMEPGSDVANMAILGVEPEKYYTGRAAIEAAAMGVSLKPDQTAFRMNLVTLTGEGPELEMADYSGGHPTPEEQKAILETLARSLPAKDVKLMPGVSFRNLCVITGFKGDPVLKPPHDHAGEKVSAIMPQGPGADLLADLQELSRSVLEDHPVNLKRREQGKPPVNGVWFWGMGRPASFPSFRQRHGVEGAVVTGVDLVRGLAMLLELEVVHVPGATGYVDTDYEGKANAVLEALKRVDFVFLHVEAPDEAAHEGDLDMKIKAIEDFDHRAVKNVLHGLKRFDSYRVLAMPDHETPVRQRCHRGGPVPYAVADKVKLEGGPEKGPGFSEKAASKASKEPVHAPRILETLLFC